MKLAEKTLELRTAVKRKLAFLLSRFKSLLPVCFPLWRFPSRRSGSDQKNRNERNPFKIFSHAFLIQTATSRALTTIGSCISSYLSHSVGSAVQTLTRTGYETIERQSLNDRLVIRSFLARSPIPSLKTFIIGFMSNIFGFHWGI